jgi:Flp pilus assembly protein TadG
MTKILLNNLRRIKRDQNGIAATEFALIAPTFMLMLMGVFDLGYSGYIKYVLIGAVEAAGRSSSLETTSTTTIDTKVRDTMKALDKAGTLATPQRLYYEKYSDVSVPEDFTDTNNNSIRDPGECYIDRNGNATWDADVGVSGRGGAQDVVVYQAEFTYQRMFPLWSILGQPQTDVITAKTYLRNQPFSAQAARKGVQICT